MYTNIPLKIARENLPIQHHISGFIGERLPTEEHKVFIQLKDGREVPLPFHDEIRRHSSFEFSWGYGGSSPAQLALAILLETTPATPIATQFYQDFKWKHLEHIKTKHLHIPIEIPKEFLYEKVENLIQTTQDKRELSLYPFYAEKIEDSIWNLTNTQTHTKTAVPSLEALFKQILTYNSHNPCE